MVEKEGTNSAMVWKKLHMANLLDFCCKLESKGLAVGTY
jgi:hypothetical protein